MVLALPTLAQSALPTSLTTTKNANQPELIAQAQRIQHALATKNYASILHDIHPTKGVRFSMYATVSPKDKVFTRANYAKYLKQSNIKFTWGKQDGTGEWLVTPLPNYLKTWVQADKFSPKNTAISYNQSMSRGNSLNNLIKFYPNANFVEFYYTGTEKYSHMDWQALRLVFETYQGKNYLVGVVSDRWTI